MENINIKAIRAAFFFNNIDLSDRLKVATQLSEALKHILNGAPVIFPIPDDAPLEIPRIVLNSKDGKYSCNIAASRLDLHYKQADKDNKIDLGKIWDSFFKNLLRLAKTIFKDLSASSYRLGLVINYEYQPELGGTQWLKDNYLTEPKDESKEVQVHKLASEKLETFSVNSWIRLISKKSTKQKKESLLVISDINTQKNEKYELLLENVTVFFDKAFKLSLKTLKEELKLN